MSRETLVKQSDPDVWQDMEHALLSLTPTGDHGTDLVNAMLLLRDERFYILPESIRIIGAGNHLVGEISSRWVIDPSREPQNRVFYGREDYKKRSGMNFANWYEGRNKQSA